MTSIHLADFFEYVPISGGFWFFDKAGQLANQKPWNIQKSTPNHINSCFSACSQISMTLVMNKLLKEPFWYFFRIMFNIIRSFPNSKIHLPFHYTTFRMGVGVHPLPTTQLVYKCPYWPQCRKSSVKTHWIGEQNNSILENMTP